MEFTQKYLKTTKFVIINVFSSVSVKVSAETESKAESTVSVSAENAFGRNVMNIHLLSHFIQLTPGRPSSALEFEK